MPERTSATRALFQSFLLWCPANLFSSEVSLFGGISHPGCGRSLTSLGVEYGSSPWMHRRSGSEAALRFFLQTEKREKWIGSPSPRVWMDGLDQGQTMGGSDALHHFLHSSSLRGNRWCDGPCLRGCAVDAEHTVTFRSS